jgi:hypothetical protein
MILLSSSSRKSEAKLLMPNSKSGNIQCSLKFETGWFCWKWRSTWKNQESHLVPLPRQMAAAELLPNDQLLSYFLVLSNVQLPGRKDLKHNCLSHDVLDM